MYIALDRKPADDRFPVCIKGAVELCHTLIDLSVFMFELTSRLYRPKTTCETLGFHVAHCGDNYSNFAGVGLLAQRGKTKIQWDADIHSGIE